MVDMEATLENGKRITPVEAPALKRFKVSTDFTAQAEETRDQAKRKESLESHRARILNQLRTFDARGFEPTNCIFKKQKVEIYYILENSESLDKEELKQNLAAHLEIELEALKLTKLRARPVYKETSIQPGDRVYVNGEAQPESSIGAFVEVQGKGIHVLMSGHRKTAGDIFRHQNGDRLGEVTVSLTSLQTASRKEVTIFRDIALGRLHSESKHESTITTGDGTVLHLNEYPEEPTEEMEDTEVRLFINGDRRCIIDSTGYNRLDRRLNIEHRLISVKNEQEQPVHDEGESGILIVTNPSGISPNGAAIAGNRVTAVGMLVSREALPVDGEETNIVSLAAPLTTGFEALRNDSYCKGATVKFC